MSLSRKLKSRRGMSMLMALMVFLILVLCGTGALTMAAANSDRTVRMAEGQQAYLSLSSAVEMVQSQFDKARCRIKFTHVLMKDSSIDAATGAMTTIEHFKLIYDDTESTVEAATESPAPAETPNVDLVKALWETAAGTDLKAYCEAICAEKFDDSFYTPGPPATAGPGPSADPDSYARPASTPAPFDAEFSVSVTEAPAAAAAEIPVEFGTVHVKMSVDENLNLKFNFNYGDDTDSLYTAEMTIQPYGDLSAGSAAEPAATPVPAPGVTPPPAGTDRETITTNYVWDLRWRAEDAVITYNQ